MPVMPRRVTFTGRTFPNLLSASYINFSFKPRLTVTTVLPLSPCLPPPDTPSRSPSGRFNQTFIDAAVAATNVRYGGRAIRVRRVVFINGSIDPWHAMGLTATRSRHAPVIYVNGRRGDGPRGAGRDGERLAGGAGECFRCV